MPRSQSSKPITHPSTVFPNPMSSVAKPIPTLPAPSFGQTMKEGFALGTGSAIAHRVVSYVFGAPTVTMQTPQGPPNPCEKERQAFENCMKTQSMDTFCGQEQLAYTSCIRVSGPTSAQ